MPKILKILFLLILGLFILYIGAEAGYQLKYRLELWKMSRAVERLNQSIIEMIKGDIYGGKTPEETFNLFVEALKNENVDLAVKYFVLDPDRRANFYEEFNQLKQEGKLKEYGEWFPEWKEWEQVKDGENKLTIESEWYLDKEETVMWPNGAGGYIETVLPAGYYSRSVNFIKNSNNIWKIENL